MWLEKALAPIISPSIPNLKEMELDSRRVRKGQLARKKSDLMLGAIPGWGVDVNRGWRWKCGIWSFRAGGSGWGWVLWVARLGEKEKQCYLFRLMFELEAGLGYFTPRVDQFWNTHHLHITKCYLSSLWEETNIVHLWTRICIYHAKMLPFAVYTVWLF